MSIKYTTAPTFASNTPLVAASASLWADAFNSRLRAGLGNPTQRVHRYLAYLFRQPRARFCTDELDPTTCYWPPREEYGEFYLHVTGSDTYGYPQVIPGEGLGANLASPGMAFVFGNASTDVWGDGDRLATASLDYGTGTPEELWALGKAQRGAYDPETGNQHWPMGDAAQQYMRIVTPPWSFHGKSYGGLAPTPEIQNTCYDADYGQYLPDYECYFTNISEDTITIDGWPYAPNEQLRFTGTAGVNSTCHQTTNVRWIATFPFAYYVWLWDGSFYYLSKDSWLIGPYHGGGKFFKPDGEQIPRLLMNSFLKDFRGTSDQRSSSCYDPREVAMGYQEFFTRQYQLAPNHATTVGDELVEEYPTFTFTPTSGVTIPGGAWSTNYAYYDGFILGGRLVTAMHLSSSATMSFYDGDTHFDTFYIPSGSSFAEIFTYDEDLTPNLRVRVDNPVTFSNASGYIQIECSQLYQYKPELYDAYAVVRMASCKGTLGDTPDQNGTDYEWSHNIYQAYDQYGCVFNSMSAVQPEQQLVFATSNPTYEAGRRNIREWARIISRTALDSYEVSRSIDYGPTGSSDIPCAHTGSHSVLYFKRNATIDGREYDLWDGIVSSSVNNIKHIAPTASWTNEWLMDMVSKPYHPSATSLWYPEVYGDWAGFISRCAFFGPGDIYEMHPSSYTGNRDLFKFIQESPEWLSDYNTWMLFPECLSAFNYAGITYHGGHPLNQMGCVAPDTQSCVYFYRSCPIMPPAYEIQSATTFQESGVDKVKLVFKTRLQHCENAPTTVTRSTGSWDISALVNDEAYRTDENAIRQYLHYIGSGINATTTKIGDNAANSQVQELGDNPFGSILPEFYFTKLIPKPYEPNPSITDYWTGSNTIISADPIIQAETYLRAMCEGFCDSETTLAYACNGSFNTAYDFIYENLCYNAFGNTYVQMFPDDVREDNISFGTLPNINAYATTMNQLGAAVNKLTKVQLHIPYSLQSKTDTYTNDCSTAWTADWPQPGPSVCSDSPSQAVGVFLGKTGPAATTLYSEGVWADAGGGASAGIGCNWAAGAPCPACADFGYSWVPQTNRYVTSFKFQLVDPDADNAMQPFLSDLFNDSGTNGFYGDVLTSRITMEALPAATHDDAAQCSGQYLFWDSVAGNGYTFQWTTEDNRYCGFFAGGVIDPGTTPPGSDYGWSQCYNGSTWGRGIDTGGPSYNISITIKNTRTPIITVPTTGSSYVIPYY